MFLNLYLLYIDLFALNCWNPNPFLTVDLLEKNVQEKNWFWLCDLVFLPSDNWTNRKKNKKITAVHSFHLAKTQKKIKKITAVHSFHLAKTQDPTTTIKFFTWIIFCKRSTVRNGFSFGSLKQIMQTRDVFFEYIFPSSNAYIDDVSVKSKGSENEHIALVVKTFKN